MKHKKIHMRCIMLAMTMTFPLFAFAQGTFFESDQLSEYSIIQNYQQNIHITYNDYYGTQISFNYVDLNSMTTHSVDISQFFRVNDFVIFDDTVFFCGSKHYNAVCGYFDINDLFFNYGTITCYELLVPNIDDANISKLHDLNRIDVMRSDTGVTHMFMTGTGLIIDIDSLTGAYTHIDYPSTIVDFWKSPTTLPCMRYTIDDALKYKYTDVTITQQNGIIAAVSSNDTGPREHIIFGYNNPVSPGESFLESWTGGSSVSNTPFLLADPNVLMVEEGNNIRLAKMEEAQFATICNNSHSSRNTLSLYNNPFSQPYLRTELPYKEHIYGFIYNPARETFYCTTTSQSSDFGLMGTMFPFANNFKEEDYNDNRWYSLDNEMATNTVILSGCNIGEGFVKKYWVYDPEHESECAKHYSDVNNEIPKDEQDGYYPQIIDANQTPIYIFEVKYSDYSIWTTCY